MTDIGVAADAGKSFARPAHRIDVMHDILMTFAAGILRHALAAWLHADGIVKMARSEGERMKKNVIRLSKILSDNVGRRVAIVARRGGAMTGFDPTIEVVLHDVAIGARSRIVANRPTAAYPAYSAAIESLHLLRYGIGCILTEA